MEGLRLPGPDTTFAELVGRSLGDQRFTLVDIGGPGIDPRWRALGPTLTAVNFVPNVATCMALSDAETLKSVHYVGSTVEADPNFREARGGRPAVTRDPRPRLAAGTIATAPERPHIPAPGKKPGIQIDLPKYLEGSGLLDLDVIALRGEGAGLGVLHAAGRVLASHRVLALSVEVNLFGSGEDTEDSFQNVDRYMRRQGFDLFDLSIQRAPNQALAASLGDELAAKTGRPHAARALYARDLCAPEMNDAVISLRSAKKAKAAAILSLYGLPDCAAEILAHFRDEMAELLDVSEGMNLLAEQGRGYPDPAGSAPSASSASRHLHRAGMAREPSQWQAEAERLRLEVACMRSSTSWRLTGPLRRAIRWVRRPSSGRIG